MAHFSLYMTLGSQHHTDYGIQRVQNLSRVPTVSQCQVKIECKRDFIISLSTNGFRIKGVSFIQLKVSPRFLLEEKRFDKAKMSIMSNEEERRTLQCMSNVLLTKHLAVLNGSKGSLGTESWHPTVAW